MGQQEILNRLSAEERRRFVHHLLHDLDVLEYMLNEGLFEEDKVRIGAEQELCLSDNFFRPSTTGPDILEHIPDPHFTTELARFNLELNLDPVLLAGGGISAIYRQLQALLQQANAYSAPFDTKVLLCGILPSLTPRELDISFLTPKPRYYALDNMLRQMRKDDFEVHIQGNDELMLRHDNILLEACNTSFQVHLQVNPKRFSDYYNWAQLISGPVLSVCVNSPLLFGKELWAETRIALFQQSLDIRTKSNHLRHFTPRVNFGHGWMTQGWPGLIRDDISRFPMLLNTATDDAYTQLQQGEIPKLKALSVFNGTIWKWNRPCYGITEGKPHLRIECRYIPSGPSLRDEIANAVLWTGLMSAMPEEFCNLPAKTDFRVARENFVKAARYGLETELSWKGYAIPASELMRRELLPLALQGLLKAGVSMQEALPWLEIIEARLSSRQTGATWQSRQFRALRRKMGEYEAQLELTAMLYENQQHGNPVSEWKVKDRKEDLPSRLRYADECMTTELFTVHPEDPAELVARIMQWRNIHHVPVEDDQGNMCGLITAKHIRREMDAGHIHAGTTARDIMITGFIHIGPGMPVSEAMQTMIRSGASCLPVIKENKLCGIVTEKELEQLWQRMGGAKN